MVRVLRYLFVQPLSYSLDFRLYLGAEYNIGIVRERFKELLHTVLVHSQIEAKTLIQFVI